MAILDQPSQFHRNTWICCNISDDDGCMFDQRERTLKESTDDLNAQQNLLL